MDDIFEKAARSKVRFETELGALSVEDLWDLPLTMGEPTRRGRGYTVVTLTSLNEIAIALHTRLQASAVSFVDPEKPADASLQLRFDIVKHIIDVRVKERDEAKEEKARSERKQKLLAVLARKQDAALEEMSEAQIRELIDAT
jgi:hypothetical protein